MDVKISPRALYATCRHCACVLAIIILPPGAALADKRRPLSDIELSAHHLKLYSWKLVQLIVSEQSQRSSQFSDGQYGNLISKYRAHSILCPLYDVKARTERRN